MELFLNFAWIVVAVAIVCLWMRIENRPGAERRLPVVALLTLIVILFPVISVSDDLWSIQNPAETDTWQRRNHLACGPHTIFPAIAALSEPGFALPRFGNGHFNAPHVPHVRAVENPALHAVQNRPPPEA